MKRTIKLRESELRRMIAESVRRVIKKWSEDYEGNDLDYQSIKMQAEDIIYKMRQEGIAISWRSVAENMGFRLETLNGEDLELLKDTIEEVMADDENPYWKEDAEFEDDIKSLPYSNESMDRKIDMIISESVKRALNEVMSPEDKWVADEEADEDMRYEMGELNKAFQKANDTYQATSSDGNFKTGDNVIVHTRKGDIEGVIADFDVNFMTYEETADVEYNENGRTRTLLGCPLDKIEKIG